jgi:hypothetical protein
MHRCHGTCAGLFPTEYEQNSSQSEQTVSSHLQRHPTINKCFKGPPCIGSTQLADHTGLTQLQLSMTWHACWAASTRSCSPGNEHGVPAMRSHVWGKVSKHQLWVVAFLMDTMPGVLPTRILPPASSALYTAAIYHDMQAVTAAWAPPIQHTYRAQPTTHSCCIGQE